MYRCPVSDKPGGAEVSSADRLAALYQQLIGLCAAASDPYELAVHLEALGYNRYRVQQEFGLDGVFRLAEKLFSMASHEVPATPAAGFPPGVAQAFIWQHGVSLLTLFAAFIWYLTGGSSGWKSPLWLLTWGQLGSALSFRAEAELDAEEAARARSIVLLIGICGLLPAALLDARPVGALVVGLLWVGSSGLLWARRAWLAGLLALATVILTLCRVETVLLLVVSVLFAPFYLEFPSAAEVQWLYRSIRLEAVSGLYGFGQGLLLKQLLVGAGGYEAVPGLLVFVVGMIWIEWRLFLFARALKKELWCQSVKAQYACIARRLLLRYVAAGALTLGAGAGLAWVLPARAGTYTLAFGLLVLLGGMGIALHAVGERRFAAVTMLAAGLTVAAGAAWTAVVSVACVAMCAYLAWIVGHPERYGLYLL